MPSIISRNSTLAYILIFSLIATFKLWLVSAIVISGATYAIVDERLFINLAASLLHHQWLGGYDQYTLAKGPGFPFWIAAMHLLHLPMMVSNALLSIIATTIVSVAIGILLKNKRIALLSFIFLALNIDHATTRIMREGFYTPMTALIFALLFLQIIYIIRHKKPSLLNSIFMGLSLSWYWVTREEGIWIIPSLFMGVGLMIYFLNLTLLTRVQKYQHFFVLILPLFILLPSLKLIAYTNNQYYQSNTVVELKENSYLSAYGSFVRVNPAQHKRFIPVTKATRQEIFAFSPAYREISPYLDRSTAWFVNALPDGCQKYPDTCNEIAGGWFMWALREAVALAGYYKNGAIAAEFYNRLTTEIDIACTQRRLNCTELSKTQLPLIGYNDINIIYQSVRNGINEIAFPKNYQHEFLASSLINLTTIGNQEGLTLFSSIIHDPIAPPENSVASVQYKLSTQNNKRLKLLVNINDLYGYFYSPLLILSSLFFIYKILLMSAYKSFDLLWILNAILLTAIIFRILILAIIDATSFPAITTLYLTPTQPLIFIFILISCINLFRPYYLSEKPLNRLMKDRHAVTL